MGRVGSYEAVKGICIILQEKIIGQRRCGETPAQHPGAGASGLCRGRRGRRDSGLCVPRRQPRGRIRGSRHRGRGAAFLRLRPGPRGQHGGASEMGGDLVITARILHPQESCFFPTVVASHRYGIPKGEALWPPEASPYRTPVRPFGRRRIPTQYPSCRPPRPRRRLSPVSFPGEMGYSRPSPHRAAHLFQ